MNRTSIENLMHRAGRTPALLAAILIFLSQASFCSGLIPAGLAVITIALGLGLFAILLDCPEAAAPLFAATVFSMLLAIPVTDNASSAFTAPSGYGRYKVTVTSSELRLDGKRRIYGVLDDGTRVASVLSEDLSSCYPSDEVIIEGDMKRADPATNPGQFDYREYLDRKGVPVSIRPKSLEVLSSQTPVSFMSSFSESLRLGFIERVTSGMDPDTKALAAALLFGDRSLLPKALSREFVLTGLNHLAAVSGTHFSGFLILFPYIMSLLGIKNRKVFCALYVVLCLFIGFLTSWTESVTRAAFMNICSFFGRDSLSSMSIAAIILMISDPYSPLSSGFLMSYAAVLTLKFIVPRITRGMVRAVMSVGNKTPWKKAFNRRFELKLSKVMALIAAACGCSLIFCLFSDSVEIRVGPLMMLINILATFIVSFICATFMPSSVLILIWHFFAGGPGLLNIPLSFMLQVFKAFIGSMSSLSYLSFGISCQPGYLITAAVAAAILAILPRCFIKMVFFRLSILILCGALGVYCADALKYGGTKIVFLDVGQGDAALIMSGGKTALIDGGVEDMGLDTLPSVLDHFNISKVDYAIMSHWDLDHAGGLLTLAAMGRVDRIYSPYVTLDDQVRETLGAVMSLAEQSSANTAHLFAIEESMNPAVPLTSQSVPNTSVPFAEEKSLSAAVPFAEEKSLSAAVPITDEDTLRFLSDHVLQIRSGDSIILSGSCRLDVISPANALSGGNEDSSVILLDAMDTKVLFTGDIGIDTEEVLMGSGALCDIDILKVAHHGSRFSTGTGFLAEVKPEYAVISVAARNSYGHPAPATLDRLAAAGCRVFCTSRSGAVTVDIGRTGYRISGYVPDTG